jgi:DNA-binding transcriptional regulator PaaX
MSSDKITTKEVLQLLGLGALIVSTAFIPSLPVAVAAVHKQWKNANKSYLGRIIKRLEDQQMISISGTDDEITIALTEKGKERLLKYSIDDMKLSNKKADGKFRLVSFDIPEAQKKSRDAFAKRLLQLGFTYVQDSLYATYYECKNEVDFLCHYYDISRYVSLIVMDRVERGEDLVWTPFHSA